AGLPAWSARRCERWPQPPAALDGAGLRPELEQSLSADAARRTRVRHPALAAAPRAAPALRPALLARHSWARALCVDGAPLVDGIADQLQRSLGNHPGNPFLPQPRGLCRRRPLGVGELARPRALLRVFLPRAATAIRCYRHAAGRRGVCCAVAPSRTAPRGVHDRRFPDAVSGTPAAPRLRLRLVSRARFPRLSAARVCSRGALDGAWPRLGGTALCAAPCAGARRRWCCAGGN